MIAGVFVSYQKDSCAVDLTIRVESALAFHAAEAQWCGLPIAITGSAPTM